MSGIQCSFQRCEKKYFLTPAQQQALLAVMADHTRRDVYGEYTICNTYYDTEDWRLIRASIEKPAYKEKLRMRSYGTPAENGKVFAELKKKCGGVVYKRRITTSPARAEALLALRLPGTAFGQIGSELEWFCRRYRPQPRVYIAYDRLAYAGIDDPDLRITFDTHIRWRTEQPELRCGDWGQPLLPDDRVLLELKLPGACPLWLSHALSDIGAYPVSFSKYGYCYKQYILPALQNNKKEAQHCA